MSKAYGFEKFIMYTHFIIRYNFFETYNIYLFEFICSLKVLLFIALTVPETIGRTTDMMTPRLTIESNSIQRVFSEKGHMTTYDASRALKRVFLSNRTVTCNDGSQAGFYLRRSLKSKRWVVFLEGGWHCFDMKSCRARWMRLRHLMTSSQWPETRDGKSINRAIHSIFCFLFFVFCICCCRFHF